MLTYWIIHEVTLEKIDTPIYFFLQSIRTHAFDIFFTFITLLINPYAIAALILTDLIFAVLLQNWRLFRYWLSICICCLLLILLLDHYMDYPSLEAFLLQEAYPLFPANNLAIATIVFSFMLLRFSLNYSPTIIKYLKFFIITVLTLASIALLYLGDNWFIGTLDAIFIGLSITLIHWIFYRRQNQNRLPNGILILPIISYLLVTFIIITLNLKPSMQDHTPKSQQFMLTPEAWWNQKKPILPMYTNNRLGRPAGLINIQYLGSLHYLQSALENGGWKKQSSSFLSLLFSKNFRVQSQLPLKTQFYLNQKPQLIMTYGREHAKPLLILSIWRSNFHLLHHHQPLWLGSIQPYQTFKLRKKQEIVPVPFNPLLTALHRFKIQTLMLPNQVLPEYGEKASLFIIRQQRD